MRVVRRITVGCMGAVVTDRLDRQPAVHDAQVELHRFGEAEAEPNRDQSRECAECPSVRHASNIRVHVSA